MGTALWLFLSFALVATSSFADHPPSGKKHRRRAEIPFRIEPPFHPLSSSPAPSIISTSGLDSPTSTSLSPVTFTAAHQRSTAPGRPDLPVVIQGDSLKILPHPGSGTQRSDSITGSGAQATDTPSNPLPLFMGYYPDWAADTFPPESLDYGRYDWIDFAFAVPTAEFGLEWDSDDAPNVLTRLVTSAHLSRCKVKLSIGGWTGSKYFSTAVSTSQSRQLFASNILSVYSRYNLDGIDLDWEYPGHEGNRGNIYDHSDTLNFLDFLILLRDTLPPSARITVAAQTFPFTDQNGEPLSDSSPFASVLDWVLIMNYDTWGSSTSPGPNAPLYDACGNSTQPEASALSSYRSWTKSGFPASKLVLGVPAYGYVQRSVAQRLRNRWYGEDDGGRPRLAYGGYRHSPDHFGHGHWGLQDSDDGWDEHWGGADGHTGWSGHSRNGNDGKGDWPDGDDNDDQGSVSPPGSPSPGRPIEVVDDEEQIQFRDLVKQGALVLAPSSSNETYPRFLASGGFERRWDFCSETPFLRSASAGQIITYDDPESLALKSRFAKEAGMLGVNMFDIHGDTDDYHLADSIRKALGLS
ncbi:chitinase [Coprinopsis cinerea okayama7|uniref:Chitinase n=1 Tax=Coprinopsis cinerea (strain Okayama-7 / 130 / ATCC MYA-4618 / FGSC 9003) TaxID=240176 RepID=A8NXU5_COPC7|nr:chitinase [Coprinopsis cinerea okayama7\|eukprot:XP_001837270.2 chitinase [Coprinopsis cinerea okayama7\